MVAKVLQRPTLVLNRNWQPVNVATVARALVLLWNESARAVDPADYQAYTWEDWSRLRPHDDERFIRDIRDICHAIYCDVSVAMNAQASATSITKSLRDAAEKHQIQQIQNQLGRPQVTQ